MLSIKKFDRMISDGMIFDNITECVKYVKNKITKANTTQVTALQKYMQKSQSELLKRIDSIYNTNIVLLEMLQKIANIYKQKTSRFKFKNDFVGVMPSVPNYVAGEPLSMFNIERNKINKKVLDIAINISYKFRHTEENIFNSCLAVVAMLTILSENNYIVNMSAVRIEYIDHNNKTFRYIFGCKIFQNAINFNKILIALQSSIFLRIVKFAWVYLADFYDDYDQGGNFGDCRINSNLSSVTSNIFNTKTICINQNVIIEECKEYDIFEIMNYAEKLTHEIIDFSKTFEYVQNKKLRSVRI